VRSESGWFENTATDSRRLLKIDGAVAPPAAEMRFLKECGLVATVRRDHDKMLESGMNWPDLS
jgi:hypothetical protein